MWTTGLITNAFNQPPVDTQTSLDDIDDIDFSCHGVQEQERNDKKLHRKTNEIRDIWSAGIRNGSNLSLRQSLSLPDSTTKKNETSMINSNDKSTIHSQQPIRTVEITRTAKEPLGFYIRQGDGCCCKTGIFISRINKGSIASCGSLLNVGDEILRINGVDIMKGYSLTDVVTLIQVQTHLILTLRSVNRTQGVNKRPGIYTRHSSPSLLKGHGKDLQKTRDLRSGSQLTTNNTIKNKQSEQFSERSNANKFDSYDLAKNTSTIDELIRLLRVHTDEQNNLKKDEVKTPSDGKHDEKHDNNTGNMGNVDITNTDFLPTQTNIYKSEKISTIAPKPAVDLIFDDEGTCATSKLHPRYPAAHPYHRITKPNHNAMLDGPNSPEFKEQFRPYHHINVPKQDHNASVEATNSPQLKITEHSGPHHRAYAPKPDHNASLELPRPPQLKEQSRPYHQIYVPKQDHNASSEVPNSPRLKTNEHSRPQHRTNVPKPDHNALLEVPSSPQLKEHSRPYQRINVPKPDHNATLDAPSSPQPKEGTTLNVTYPPRSRSNSRGSGSGPESSPKPRRRLPSLPTDDGHSKRRDSTLRRSLEQKPRRKLPTPPASPVMEQKRLVQSFGLPSERRQKTLSWGGPESDSLTEIEELNSNNCKPLDDNNNRKMVPSENLEESKQVDNTDGHEHRRYSQVYRRSKSQHSDFFEQQRHSMFLQTFSSGKSMINSSMNTTSLSMSLDSSGVESLTEKSDIEESASRNVSPSVKTKDGSPAMRRHASSSLLFRKSRDTSPASGQGKVESEPGFLVFPDDYKAVDLSCSHAVSGMMKVRIIKAANLNLIDKKKYKKICCVIEVDFERKASTLQKKVTRNPSWDEVFEVEIQHGREMTFMCYGSKKEFDKPIARMSFYLTPLVRQSKAHHVVLRLSPEGLLYIELEFTEIKALLNRTPSSKNSGVFGFNLSVTSEQEQSEVPLIVRKCVNEIEKRGLGTVGLYRISGNARNKEKLKAQFEENSQEADISEDNCPDINVVTGILKDYLRELPDPLISHRTSQQLLQAIEENIQQRDTVMKKTYLSKLMSELPATTRKTLAFILCHLCRVVNNKENKMDTRNISVCLAPVLQYSPMNLCEPKDLLGLKSFLKAVEVLIDLWNDVETMDKEDKVLHV